MGESTYHDVENAVKQERAGRSLVLAMWTINHFATCQPTGREPLPCCIRMRFFTVFSPFCCAIVTDKPHSHKTEKNLRSFTPHIGTLGDGAAILLPCNLEFG